MSKRGPDKKPRKKYARRTVWERMQGKFIPDTKTGCWQWTAAVMKNGYGKITAGGYTGKLLLAHRASWEIFRGPISVGLFVCHKCDNPGCINPDHLFLGTPAENTADAVRKGRMKGPNVPASGEKASLSKLTEEDIEEIRNSNDTSVSIGLRFGVHRNTIYLIRSGKTWRSALKASNV